MLISLVASSIWHECSSFLPDFNALKDNDRYLDHFWKTEDLYGHQECYCQSINFSSMWRSTDRHFRPEYNFQYPCLWGCTPWLIRRLIWLYFCVLAYNQPNGGVAQAPAPQWILCGSMNIWSNEIDSDHRQAFSLHGQYSSQHNLLHWGSRYEDHL